MEKIFDEEVQNYLASAGVSKTEIAKIKYKALREESIKTLRIIIGLISNEQYDKVKDFTKHSSSGDGYGSENDYIDFSDITGTEMDIITLCDLLEELKQIINKK